MKDVDVAELYADDVYQVVDNRDSIFEKIILREAKRVLRQAECYLDGDSRMLLDFGSGKGQFLLQGKRMGWSSLGIETARDRAEFAKKKYGVEVKEELYSGGAVSEQKFDLITLNHVLEHLPEPMSILYELLEHNLQANGVLMIEVPRLDSWQSKIAGTNWMHLDIPKHLSHWTEQQLIAELEKMGFKPIGCRRFSIHLGVLGMLQSLASRTGYNGNIILALKRRRTLGLVIRVAFLLPSAVILELAAVPFSRTGIIGLYLRRSKGTNDL
jgi:SAM-dependent methyltransferase